MNRTKGTTGQILIEYLLLYLSSDVSDPSEGQAGQVAAAGNSVQMEDGQATVNVTVTLYDDAFLEEGAKLYVELNGTQLTGGGM